MTGAAGPITGGCLCRAVRYAIDAAPLKSGICYCETCRRAASAPALPYLTVPLGAFRVTAGEPRVLRASATATRRFCGDCGSPLTYQSASESGLIDVMTCSLDDPGAFPPTEATFEDERLEGFR